VVGSRRELVGELEALVARYPLREGLRREHMLALYRAGRQADALDAYQALRRTMTEQLGIEPSHELKALQHNIFTHDRNLDLHAPERAARNQGGAGAGARTGRFKQRIRFCTAIDGLKIAYASHGTVPRSSRRPTG